MKTEAIRQAAERLRASGHFGLASQVDEEADVAVEVAQALKAIVNTKGFTAWLTSVDPEGEQAANAMDALRKIGAQ